MPLQKNSKFVQGIFVPKNKNKFIGDKAVYRSSLELRFMKFCDCNEACQQACQPVLCTVSDISKTVC